MDVLDLFPRSILRGTLPDPLLQQLTVLSESVLAHPESSPDASAKLAGQLRQQRELRPDQPGVQELSNNHLLPACDRWIRHVMDRQPPQGRGPWVPGRYRLQMINLWLNCQTAGDYNPTHTRTGMAHYVLPVPGEFYVFPAWQPHSVMPFRGDGERWSLAFNVVAAPGVPPTAMQQPAPKQKPLGNVSLSSQRPTAKGF